MSIFSFDSISVKEWIYLALEVFCLRPMVKGKDLHCGTKTKMTESKAQCYGIVLDGLPSLYLYSVEKEPMGYCRLCLQYIYYITMLRLVIGKETKCPWYTSRLKRESFHYDWFCSHRNSDKVLGREINVNFYMFLYVFYRDMFYLTSKKFELE